MATHLSDISDLRVQEMAKKVALTLDSNFTQ